MVGVVEGRMERLAHPEGFSPAGLKVLVVDDDNVILKILERMLRECKYAGELRFSLPPPIFVSLGRGSLLREWRGGGVVLGSARWGQGRTGR